MNFFCSKDCPDLCGVSFTSISPYNYQGQAQDWSSPGFACQKFRTFIEREVNNGEPSWRLNNGAKETFANSGEALHALTEYLATYRDKKILYLRGSGSLGYNMACWDLFFSAFPNCQATSGGPCDDTGSAAHQADFGVVVNPDVNELEKSEAIMLYGKNAKATSPHLYTYLKQLKKQGKQLIYIDPFRAPTAELADRYLQIRPGCDGLLACALLSALGLEDGYDPDRLISQCGISRENFDLLLALLKNSRVAHIQGSGLQRQQNGMNAFRWINRLAVKTGSQDLLFWTHGSKRLWEKPQTSFAGYVHIDRIAAALVNGDFDLFVCVAANPAMTFPDSNLWRQALTTTPSLVIGTGIDETSRHADFFLKVGGMFAQDDFMGSYFFPHHFQRERLTAELSDLAAATLLADSLKLNFSLKPQAQLKRIELPERHYRTGQLDLDAPDQTAGFQLLTSSHMSYLNSQILPGMEEGLQTVHIHPEDARNLALQQGDEVRIAGSTGSFVAEAVITTDIAPGTLMCWKNVPMKQGQANNAIPARLTDAVDGLAYYAARVRLEPVVSLKS